MPSQSRSVDPHIAGKSPFAADLFALLIHLKQGTVLAMQTGKKGVVCLRAVTVADRTLITHWAEAIGSSNFMARCEPLPDQDLIWDIIQVDGQDAGVVWLERTDTSAEARLGIMLGATTLLGQGIGAKAISLIVEKAKTSLSLHAIVLNVRESNTRAIACYENCGFEAHARSVRTKGDLEYAVLGMRKRLT